MKKGFSLVEVLVSMAIGGLVIGVVMMLSTNSYTSGTMAKASVAHESLVNQITQLLANEQSCRLALGGPQVHNGPDYLIAQTVTAGPNPPPTNIRLFMPIQNGFNRTVLYDPADPTKNRYGPLTITSLTIQPLNPGTSWALQNTTPAKITLTTTSTINQQRTSSNIYLTVFVNLLTRISDCYPLTYSTDENAAPICPGPAYNVWGYKSTGTRMECRIIRCGYGGVPCGTELNGDVHCQATCP
ncbi:MAG: PilW family protein [Bdellovibrionales bacterium]